LEVDLDGTLETLPVGLGRPAFGSGSMSAHMQGVADGSDIHTPEMERRNVKFWRVGARCTHLVSESARRNRDRVQHPDQ
jgi:hypothetical protein